MSTSRPSISAREYGWPHARHHHERTPSKSCGGRESGRTGTEAGEERRGRGREAALRSGLGTAWTEGACCRGLKEGSAHLRVPAQVEVGDLVARGARDVGEARGAARLAELRLGREVADVQLRAARERAEREAVEVSSFRARRVPCGPKRRGEQRRGWRRRGSRAKRGAHLCKEVAPERLHAVGELRVEREDGRDHLDELERGRDHAEVRARRAREGAGRLVDCGRTRSGAQGGTGSERGRARSARVLEAGWRRKGWPRCESRVKGALAALARMPFRRAHAKREGGARAARAHRPPGRASPS